MLLESAKLMNAFNMAKCVVGYFLLFLELGGMGGVKCRKKWLIRRWRADKWAVMRVIIFFYLILSGRMTACATDSIEEIKVISQ